MYVLQSAIVFCITHRSPPVDQPNLIILPSSDVNEYSGRILCDTVSHIVNPARKLLILFFLLDIDLKILWVTFRCEGSR